VQASAGVIILFIDEIHTVIGAGDSGGALDASNIIKPFLARGQLQLIGTTTTAEYRKYFEKDKAFERRFQPIMCEEPTEEVAVTMLQALKPKYEKFHSVTITQEAMDAAVKLSKKYIGERYLPDKAVDLLDEASAEVKLEHARGKRQDTNVVKSDIEKVVSSWTGIPITKLTEDESAKLLHLEDIIHKRLIDQQEAVVSVAEAVRRGRIGLAS
jgi:ATP-dependent Clp protease ATP-binding subunit ClpC